MSSRPSSTSTKRSRRIDAVLYLGAAISYIWAATYHLWLLDWIIGPAWCVAWVWGIPALGRLLRGQPVRPRREG